MSNPWSDQSLVEAWVRSAEARNRVMAPATERMFALAGIRAGMRVLDVGAGTGDTTLLLAARVGASGSVLATDLSPEMVSAIVKAVEALRLPNVTAEVADTATLAVAPQSFDAAVARNSLMFVDLDSALRAIHRALKPGGRFAAITWSELARNPYNGIIVDAARTHGRLPAKTPELVRAHSLCNEAALRESFTRAGFSAITVEAVPTTRRYPSLAD